MEEAGAVFGLTHNYSGYALVRHAARLVRDGSFGKVRLVQVEHAHGKRIAPQQSWRTDPAVADEASVMFDLGTHAHHLLRFVTGLEVTEVSAQMSKIVPNRVIFDNAHVNLRPGAIDLRARHVPPFGTGKKGTFHLLGTDGLGRDVFSRLLFAGRVSLAVGFAGVLVSGLIGSTIGIVAGYKRGRVEGILMRLVDLQMSIPFLLLALIVLFTIGSGVNNVVIVLALSRWPVYARVSRGLVPKSVTPNSSNTAASRGRRACG